MCFGTGQTISNFGWSPKNLIKKNETSSHCGQIKGKSCFEKLRLKVGIATPNPPSLPQKLNLFVRKTWVCGCPCLLFDSFSSVCGDQYPNVVSDYPNISIYIGCTDPHIASEGCFFIWWWWRCWRWQSRWQKVAIVMWRKLWWWWWLSPICSSATLEVLLSNSTVFSLLPAIIIVIITSFLALQVP